MAHLYITLGIDPEKILPGTTHKTQSELWDSDGIWTYVEYHAERRTTEDVTIIYKVFIDWMLTNPTSAEGKSKAARLKADFAFNPLKTVEETIQLEKLDYSGISGNDMSSSGNEYDMAPRSIDPKYATAYAAHDAQERIIVRWLKKHKEQISTLISDVTGISQGVAESKMGNYAKTAEELMLLAKGTKEFAEMNEILAGLQKSFLSLKTELEAFAEINNQTIKAVQDPQLFAFEKIWPEMVEEALNRPPSRPAIPRKPKLPSGNVETHIRNTLKNSAQRAVHEVASTARNGTRIATAEEMALAKAAASAAELNKAATQLESVGKTAQESSKALGQAAKWLKRAGYVGLALQGGCVLLNGLFAMTADEGDERNNAIQTFADSAGTFAISVEMYIGVAAIGGPVGIGIGIGLAVFDILLLGFTSKSSADYIWEFLKCTQGGWENHIKAEFNCLTDPNNSYRLCAYGNKQ
jgi:NADH dehydrogenase/NADH:ubiquinone oxidoreductase subunit G